MPFLFGNGMRFALWKLRATYGRRPHAVRMPRRRRNAFQGVTPCGKARKKAEHTVAILVRKHTRAAPLKDNPGPCPARFHERTRIGFVSFPAPRMNVRGHQVIVCRGSRHKGLPKQRIPVLAFPCRARLAFPVVPHIGHTQALPERGDPFRRRAIRQQSLTEAPEGLGVGSCLFRNRDMKVHQATSSQQPCTQQG